MKDLGLDSLDQVEIIMAMEDEFGKAAPGSPQPPPRSRGKPRPSAARQAPPWCELPGKGPPPAACKGLRTSPSAPLASLLLRVCDQLQRCRKAERRLCSKGLGGPRLLAGLES